MHTVQAFLGENGVPFVAHALRDVPDRISVIEKDGQNLPLLHHFQFQFRFDEVVGTDDASEIQLHIRLDGSS